MNKGIKKGGRTMGTPNKRTSEQLKRIEFVLSLLDKKIESDIKEISPSERVKLWASLQEYIRPKLTKTELKAEVEVPQKTTIIFTKTKNE